MESQRGGAALSCWVELCCAATTLQALGHPWGPKERTYKRIYNPTICQHLSLEGLNGLQGRL